MRVIALSPITFIIAASLVLAITPKGSSAQTPPEVENPYTTKQGTSDITSMFRVIWTVPNLPVGTPSITGYEVRYRVDDGEDWEDRENWDDWIDHAFDSDGTTTETTITGLQSNTAYYAQVRAVNADGQGLWSQGILWAMTERAHLTVALGSDTYTLNEGSTVDITVNVYPTADHDVTVTVEITEGTGATLSALDDNMLTIEKGQSSASFTISGDDDNDAMNAEVTITLYKDEYDQYQRLGTPSTAIVTVIDDEEANNPPVITATSTITVQENRTAVTTLEATDPDDDPITGWSISGGVDGSLFSLTNNGVLTFVAAPDYENPRDDSNVNSYVVKVIANDGTDDSAELTLTVNVTDVDEPPSFMMQPAFSADGASDTTSMLNLEWSAPTLPASTPAITGYEVQYRVKDEIDWTAHDFDSFATTTETTIAGLASNTHYEAQVRAVNDEGPGGWSPISSADTTEARLTVAFDSASYRVDEGGTATTTVIVTPNTDRNVAVTITMTGTGVTLPGLMDGALTIARGQHAARFTISGDQDNDAINEEVTLKLTTDENEYVFLGSPSTTTVTVLDDETTNLPPTFATSTVNLIVPEDLRAETFLGDPIAATDPEHDSLTYTLSGEGSERFNVNNQGQITLGTSLNYEVLQFYTLTLSVRDGKDDIGNRDSETDASVTVNVTVVDVDEPPGGVDPVAVSALGTRELLARWSIAQNTGPDLTYQVQYRVDGVADWTDLGSNDDARETTIPDLASNTTYQVRVRARNDEGDGPWSIGIGATEKAQLNVAFGSTVLTVHEGDIATTTVMLTPTADRDVTVTVTMTGAGATLFGLDMGNKLTVIRGQNSSSFIVSGDQDNDAMYNDVTLALSTVADGVAVGNPSTTTVTIIDDDDPNSPPEFSTSTVALSIPEDSPIETPLGDPTLATDPESDLLTYALSGEDSEIFELNDRGQVSLRGKLDHEDTPSYTLILSVSDGKDGIGNPDSTADASITINIKVKDVDEPPDAPTNVVVSTNVRNPTAALDVTWTSPDTKGNPPITDYNVQYRKLGQGVWIQHRFKVTRPKTIISSLSAGTSYEVRVRAKNDEGESDWSASDSGATQATTPSSTTPLSTDSSSEGGSVQESNTAPSFGRSSVTFEVNENLAKGSKVGSSITAKDSDRDDRITYSLSGDDESSFRVDRGSGQITVAGELDFETINSYFLTMIATDEGGLKGEIDITIKVTNVDEPAVIVLSSRRPITNKLIIAKLIDQDGEVSDVVWKWQTSPDGRFWTNVEEALSPRYTPVSTDEAKFLRVSALYIDGHGPGKIVESSVTSPVLPSPDMDPTVLAAIVIEAGGGDIVQSRIIGAHDSVHIEVGTPSPGWVTVVTRSSEGWDALPGFILLGATFDIAAPMASAGIPLVIRFHISTIESPTSLVVFKDGVVVDDCVGAADRAVPDPCVSARTVESSMVLITVLSSEASIWQLGIADEGPAPTPTLTPAPTTSPYPTSIPALTPTPEPTSTPLPTPEPKSSPEPTPVPTPTLTPTPTPILTPMSVQTPTRVSMITATPTAVPVPTPESAATPTPSHTPAPMTSRTPDTTTTHTSPPLPIVLLEPVLSPTATPTSTPSPTLTPMPEPAATSVPTAEPTPSLSKSATRNEGLPLWVIIIAAAAALGLTMRVLLSSRARSRVRDNPSS